MLEKSSSFLFYLKKPKSSSESKNIYLRLTVEGIISEVSIRRSWTQERWNSKLGRANGYKEDAKELNAYLDAIMMKVLQAKKYLMDNNRIITAKNLKNTLLGVDETKRFILKEFEAHNQKMRSLIGIEFAKGTFKRYSTALNHTKKFIKWKYKVEDIELSKLDYEFISEYSYWYRTENNCSHNTTMKYLTYLKKIVLLCLKKGWINRDPFLEFKLSKKEVEKEYLTKAELKHIADKDFGVERLNQVRDIFIFSCYTGLAYVDSKNLRRDQIIVGIDGEKWIVTARQKTKTPTKLPLLPQAMKILNAYKHFPTNENKGLALPVISNQKMNAYLKEIAVICKINKLMTFHMARHTFATTVTLSNGVPIETVSKMLGHKSLQQTQHYAKILDTKISFDMKALREKLQ